MKNHLEKGWTMERESSEPEKIRDFIRTIRKEMGEGFSSSEGSDLSPNEVQRYELNRQLLSSMEQRAPLLHEHDTTLRINQFSGLQNLVQFLGRGGNTWNSGYFRQPTGAGKTVLFGMMAWLMDTKTIILTPKKFLQKQTLQELVDVVGISREKIGLVGGGRFDIGKGKQFLIGTYRTHGNRMGRDPQYTKEILDSSLVICDEAHRSLGKETRDALEKLGLRKKEGRKDKPEDIGSRLTLGFTATTELIQKSVRDLYGELIAEEHFDDLVAAGILVPFEIVKADTATIYEDEIQYISQKDEADILEREGVYYKLNKALLDLRNDTKEPLYPVAFCSSHQECKKYCADGDKLGLRSQIVTGYERDADVKAIEKAERELLKGKIDQIVTVDLLSEGWDFRPANVAIMARASQSPARVLQSAGRTARSFDGFNDPRYGEVMHTPYVKSCSYVIETEWELKSRSTDFERVYKEATDEERKRMFAIASREVRGGKPPVDLLEALGSIGEDATKTAKRHDGKPITQNRLIDLPEGEVELDGKIIITPPAYVRKPEKAISIQQLQRVIGESIIRGEIRSVPNVRWSGNRTMLLYWEKDLDRIVEEWSKLQGEKEERRKTEQREQEEVMWKILDPVTDEVAIDWESLDAMEQYIKDKRETLEQARIPGR